jgi:hypothetical protein
MRVIYTEEALENLDGILAYISAQLPDHLRRISKSSPIGRNRIADWPDSA